MATKKATSTAQLPRSLDYMRLDDIKHAERNAKTHADMSGSVVRFGFIESMVLDERTGRLVAGHGRHEHLVQLHAAGADAPEGVIVADDGAWLAPVTRGWSSRDDAEAMAAGIALNRWNELGGWDSDELAAQLDELRVSDYGLAGVGYSEDDLVALLGGEADDPTVTAGGGGHPSFDTVYKIVIVCETEAQQKELLDELATRGLRLQALFQ